MRRPAPLLAVACVVAAGVVAACGDAADSLAFPPVTHETTRVTGLRHVLRRIQALPEAGQYLLEPFPILSVERVK